MSINRGMDKEDGYIQWNIGGVQLHSRVQLFVTPCTAALQASLSLTISWSLPKFMSTGSVMPSSHLILWCPLLLLLSIFPSVRDFSKKSAVCIRWPKYWSLSFSISPSKRVDFPWNWLVWSPFCPRDSQESSPAHSWKVSILQDPNFIKSSSHNHI